MGKPVHSDGKREGEVSGSAEKKLMERGVKSIWSVTVTAVLFKVHPKMSIFSSLSQKLERVAGG